jgi:propanol-preferring alcohol dehydrogenase
MTALVKEKESIEMSEYYKAIQVTAPGTLELVEREISDPEAGHVRIRVEACGVCHSDSPSIEGNRSGAVFPRIPGHEIIGRIEAVAWDVSNWAIGQRVGVGYLGGNCGICTFCRRGDLVHCENQPRTGSTVDGGYSEVVYARSSGLVRLPEDLPAESAPLLCAGLTTFNALRRAQIPPGSTVGIQGIGGLGHLGLQFARAMGFTVVAIGRGTAKEEEAYRLGASHYVDTATGDLGLALRELGGVDAILATAPSGPSMSALVDGLSVNGHLVVVGTSAEPLPLPVLPMVFGGLRISGSLTGTTMDNEDTVRYSIREHVNPIVETMPLERAAEAYVRMMSGNAHFRMVLTMGC